MFCLNKGEEMNITRIKDLKELLKHYNVKCFFTKGNLVGVRHKSYIIWHKFSLKTRSYFITGSTRNPGIGTVYHRKEKV